LRRLREGFHSVLKTEHRVVEEETVTRANIATDLAGKIPPNPMPILFQIGNQIVFPPVSYYRGVNLPSRFVPRRARVPICSDRPENGLPDIVLASGSAY